MYLDIALDQELLGAFFGVPICVPTDKEIDEALREAGYDPDETKEEIRNFVSKCLQGAIQ